MRIARDFTRYLLFCAAASLLLASAAGAQIGAPDVPTGPAPHCVTPVLGEPSPSGPPVVFPLWGGFAPRLYIQQTWSFFSVAPPTASFHPATLRESRGRSLPVSKAAAGRLIKR
jgi:hypothetical protein